MTNGCGTRKQRLSGGTVWARNDRRYRSFADLPEELPLIERYEGCKPQHRPPPYACEFYAPKFEQSLFI